MYFNIAILTLLRLQGRGWAIAPLASPLNPPLLSQVYAGFLVVWEVGVCVCVCVCVCVRVRVRVRVCVC